MSGNTLGTLFTVTSFGESHGPAIGCIVDGCPPGLALCEADIQAELDRRKPGTSRHVTQRREPDTVEILSGVFEGVILPAKRPCLTARETRCEAGLAVERKREITCSAHRPERRAGPRWRHSARRGP